jgi:hypothetical protein
MTVVGELTAGDVVKTTDEKCRTCGIKGKLTPAGYCFDVHGCTERRKARVSGIQHLRFPCLVKLRRYGSTYYVREFGPKIAPPPLIMPPGFTIADYTANPAHRYYEALMEVEGRPPSDATSFQVRDALVLAKMFNGTVVNK